MHGLRSLTLAFIAGFVLVAAPANPAAAASWSAPTQVASADAGNAVLDGNGKLHVVTETAGIGYVTNVSGSWFSHDVTHHAGDVDASIAVSGGKVYIAFVRLDVLGGDPQPSTGILLATDRTGAWKVTRLTSHADVSPSIKVLDGRVHIAYNDGNGVRYLSEGASSWTNDRVWKRAAGLGTSLGVARVSLALDIHSKAHIAFDRQPADPEARGGVSYATNASGSWKTTNLRSGYDHVDRILLDGAGRPHIGYNTGRTGPWTYRILRRSGSSWATTTAPGSGWGSFSLDGQDRYEVVFAWGSTLTWYAQRSSAWLSKSWTVSHLADALVRAANGGTTYVLYTIWSSDRTFVRIRS
jgi:hypothetical protein